LPLIPPLDWWLVAVPLAAVAFALRIGVHAGREPGGVDTWYYLAYADAFRARPSLDVRLPQYLLHDPVESYPPVFPSLLGLLPRRWLERSYWLVSPTIDCAHLLLLSYVAYRLTASLGVATLAASAYALTPHLVSETRSLTARPFGSLMATLALLLMLKAIVTGEWLGWYAVAALAGAVLFLSSAALAAAYGVVSAVLSLVFLDPRYLLLAFGGLGLAFLLSGGRMMRVIRNYVNAVRHWQAHRGGFGAHPVAESPVYGAPRPGTAAERPGLLGASRLQEILRLLGENPFLLALLLAPQGLAPWTQRLYVWAAALAALSVVATLWPPLRAFGPGRSYMKAAIFPTAYTIAFGVGSAAGLHKPLGLVTLACLGLSALAIAFFYAYVRSRPTEQTASIPLGLRDAVRHLAGLPRGGVFVLPYMYADYTAYRSGQPVLWGGHSGSLDRFAEISPVIARPLPELFARYGVRYVLLDEPYVRTERLQAGLTLDLEGAWGSVSLYRVGAPSEAAASGSPA
jgi:hypothetical protein